VKSISVQWTPEIQGADAEVVVSTVAHLQEVMMVLGQHAGFSLSRGAIRPFGTWVIPSVKEGAPYWSTLWYVQTSYEPSTGQISGPRFIDAVRAEPWQRAGPHYDVAIVHTDLTDRSERTVQGAGAPYVLAAWEPNLAAVLSVYRMQELVDARSRRIALRRLALHAFGRVLELPGPGRTEAVEMRHGAPACTNRCVMRTAADVATSLDFGREEFETRTLFCAACTSDLLNHIVATHFSRN